MKYTSSAKAKIWLLLLFAVLSISSFLYNRHLIQEMEKKERYNVELWAEALRLIGSAEQGRAEAALNDNLQRLDSLKISATEKRALKDGQERVYGILSDLSLSFATDILLQANNFKIPTIQVDSSGRILQQVHIDIDSDLPDSLILASFKEAGNPPISFEVGLEPDTRTQFVYYKESAILRLMRYFPYFQLLFFSGLMLIGYVSFSSIRKNEQSNLWVGMAKEAAHQLGTPISSLIGWIELLRQQADQPTRGILLELDQDVSRLQRVADRFNKIGSKPDLKEVDLRQLTDHVIQYMHKRLPSLGGKVHLSINGDAVVNIKANAQLLEWALENLTKNAIDALKYQDKAFVKFELSQQSGMVTLDIEDNGKGIDARNHTQIFRPGYSTKSRGWGLGLSLTRRIIEEYHGGKVFVLRSRPNEGTIFRILLPIETNN